MHSYWFTFGVGYDLADAAVVIEAASEMEAREAFIDARYAAGLNARKGWSAVYPARPAWVVREVPVTTPAVGSD